MATDEALLSRYKRNYHIPDDAPLMVQDVRKHWDLERALAAELLASPPTTRRDVFERCYTRLYDELPWLNALPVAEPDEHVIAGGWAELIGLSARDVYEVGSGKGALISSLARAGYACRGSEITSERGRAWVPDVPGLSWGATDGVHLDAFEPRHSYDIVISSQVIEHLHPDDLSTHLESARAILRAGGRYIISTPHRAFGPCDVSAVFECDSPRGMHLREYTYAELEDALLRSGFAHVAAVVRAPTRVYARLGRVAAPRASMSYLRYLKWLEQAICAIRPQPARRRAALSARALLFTANIWIIARTAASP